MIGDDTKTFFRAYFILKISSFFTEIVDLLKVCISSIQSSNAALTDTSDSTTKPNKFLDELNSLISNATNLTKSLDKIDQSSAHTQAHKKILNSEDPTGGGSVNDVDMENGVLVGSGSSSSISGRSDNNNNNTEEADLVSRTSSKHRLKDQIQAENCDFKDVFLCNLIDDFLLKENEF